MFSSRIVLMYFLLKQETARYYTKVLIPFYLYSIFTYLLNATASQRHAVYIC